MPDEQVELLYLAWNRLKFTSLTWHLMVENTDWDLVSKLTVYDDGSEDGTQEFLRDNIDQCPVDHELRIGDFRSPPAVMNHFLATCEAPFWFKIDSDIALPPGYLDQMMTVMRKNPDLIVLGSEPGQGAKYDDQVKWHKAERANHIGGVGLMRTEWFHRNPPLPSRGRFGWTEYQYRYNVPRAWITPDLRMPQLDRVPLEPWVSLSETYIENGWQREWPKMDGTSHEYWSWFSNDYGEQP